jgi:DNA-binding NarL/FixJ family response regulator
VTVRKTSVLIVDDHESIRRTLRSRFEALPEFSICGEAVDGFDAVQKAQQLTPDLVVLDFAMPGMSGLEVAVALRCMIPSVRLFLLTVHTSWEMELAARDAEVDAVFSKYENLNALFKQARLGCVVREADTHAE